MKNISILILLVSITACNKGTTEETKNSSVIWANNIQTTVPMVRDTLWNEEDWNATFKYNKKTIFESISKAVISGKLKAYSNYPDGELTIDKFKDILAYWDSTIQIEDPNVPGTMISAPTHYELTPDDFVQIRLSEKMEMDTVSYTLTQKVSYMSFIGYAFVNGQMMGLKKLFDVKMNEPNTLEAKK